MGDLLALRGKLHVDTDHPKAAETTLEGFLTQLFDFTKIPENEISILQNLAILPSVDIPQEDLEDFLQITGNERVAFINHIHELAERGCLIRTESKEGKPVFRCHQIVQVFVRRHKKYKPTVEVCKRCIETFIWKLKIEPEDNSLQKAVWVPYGVEILEGLEGEDAGLATLANNLAVVYQNLGDLPKALEYSKKALVIYEKILASDHPLLANSYANIALIYQDLGDLSKALEYSRKALGIYESVLASDHPYLATSYSNIATIYQDLGDLPKALAYSRKALVIRESVLASGHPDLASAYYNLAWIYQEMGDLPKALGDSMKALGIYQAVFASDHPSLANSYNNIGLIYQEMGDLPKALEYEQKALAIYEKVLVKDHPGLANSYNNNAVIHFDIGEFDVAKKYIEKAIDIWGQIFPNGHPILEKARKWRELIEKRLLEKKRRLVVN